MFVKTMDFVREISDYKLLKNVKLSMNTFLHIGKKRNNVSYSTIVS